jgi:hypothetical protein
MSTPYPRIHYSRPGRYFSISNVSDELYYGIFELYNSAMPDHGSDHSEKDNGNWVTIEDNPDTNTWRGFVPDYDVSDVLTLIQQEKDRQHVTNKLF